MHFSIFGRFFKSSRTSHDRGFTLIELVLVIILLGILAIAAAAKFLGLTGQARAQATKAGVGAIREVAIMKYAENASVGNPSYPSLLLPDYFVGGAYPINRCNQKGGIETVATAPGGTEVSADKGFWYISSSGEAGAYAEPSIAECSDTSGF